mmetsp:Transcript_30/g.83  ORF Transcript_30/g.83 Transcript_30/m.83 type:complete len:245 (+) Transcript_30:184-918(+)
MCGSLLCYPRAEAGEARGSLRLCLRVHGARQITAHGGPVSLRPSRRGRSVEPQSRAPAVACRLAGIEQLHQHADERLVEQVAPAHVRLAHALEGVGGVGVANHFSYAHRALGSCLPERLFSAKVEVGGGALLVSRPGRVVLVHHRRPGRVLARSDSNHLDEVVELDPRNRVAVEEVRHHLDLGERAEVERVRSGDGAVEARSGPVEQLADSLAQRRLRLVMVLLEQAKQALLRWHEEGDGVTGG